MSYDNTNRFSIWKNEDKRNDKDADFTGTLDVDGIKYFINAWKRKEGASPKAPPLSGSIKRKDKQEFEMVSTGKHSYTPGGKVKREDPISTGRPRASDMDDDSIPFAPEFR